MPMGQQAYETQLQNSLVRHASDVWEVSHCSVLPARARQADHRAGARRLPLGRLSSAPYAVASLLGSLAYGRPDVVHRLDLRCPPSRHVEVITIHDLPPLRFDDEGSIPSWAARSAREAAAIICPSHFAAEEVRSLLGARHIHVIPYGMDASRSVAKPFGLSDLADVGLDQPLVVHAAGATTRKNLPLLAAVWPDVVSACPNAHLALCGPPSARRTDLFAPLQQTRYLGHRAPDFMARLIKTAAVVVVPSIYEGFGLPALEAMIAGTTVVATECGALPEVIGDGGMIVRPTRSEFAEAIIAALAGGPAIAAMRSSGRERALGFSWEKCARSTADVYAEVSGTGGA
jgi:glycosyltransferase involved in cell wall biosynthesis